MDNHNQHTYYMYIAMGHRFGGMFICLKPSSLLDSVLWYVVVFLFYSKQYT